MDEKEFNDTVSEIREWLVRIDENQKHQTELLESLTKQAEDAFQKADSAEDKAAEAQKTADEALKMAKGNKETFDQYEKDEKVTRRWAIGLVTGVVMALLPILNQFYL